MTDSVLLDVLTVYKACTFVCRVVVTLVVTPNFMKPLQQLSVRYHDAIIVLNKSCHNNS